MSNVVVTGAPGFLGTQLVQALLAQGRKVICVVHPSFRGKSASELFPGVEKAETLTLVFKDLLAPQEEFLRFFTGAQTLFNCAGAQHPEKTQEIYRTNRDGVVHLLKVCRAWKVQNFIHVSSSTVLGSGSTGLSEKDHGLQPGTHYARSKMEGDQLLLQEAHQHPSPKVVILAPAVFYGFPASQNLVELMIRLKSGKLLPLMGNLMSNEGCLRSYVDLQKVITALLAAEEKGKHAQVYALADKKPLTTLEFYESIGRGLGVVPKTLVLPQSGARIAEKIAYAWGKLNMHSKYLTVLGELGRHHQVISEKAEQELGMVLHRDPAPGLEAMAREWGKEK